VGDEILAIFGTEMDSADAAYAALAKAAGAIVPVKLVRTFAVPGSAAAASAPLAAAPATTGAPALVVTEEVAPPPSQTHEPVSEQPAESESGEFDSIMGALMGAGSSNKSTGAQQQTATPSVILEDTNDNNENGRERTASWGQGSRMEQSRPSVQLDSDELQRLIAGPKKLMHPSLMEESDDWTARATSPFPERQREEEGGGGNNAPEYCAHHLSEIRDLVRQNSADDFAGFKNEFKIASMVGLKHSTIAADRPANKTKNRFTNVKPYDHSRVKLSVTNNDPESDYINANLVPGFNGEHEFIAAQGPTPHDGFQSFWRMIWERETTVVVMVTAEVESNRRKCHRYWPDPTSTPPQPVMRYGPIVVRHDETVDKGDYTIRKFTMQHEGVTRILTHLCFTAWPDRGMPFTASSLIEMRQTMRTAAAGSGMLGGPAPPIVVHCSTGVSRTGTFIAMDTLASSVEHRTPMLSVEHTVTGLRNGRVEMVQTLAQYIFVYKGIETFLELEVGSALRAKKAAEEKAASKTATLPKNGGMAMQVPWMADIMASAERTLEQLAAVPLAQWTCPEVIRWVSWLEMDQYVEAFSQEGIDGATLLVISESLLISLGFTDEMDQMMFLTALHGLEVEKSRALTDAERDIGFRGFPGRHRLLEIKEAALMSKQTRSKSMSKAERLATPIQVFTTSVDASTVYKRLFVRKSDRVNDVISMLLERFSLTLPDPNPWRYELVEISKKAGSLATVNTEATPVRRVERVLPENDKIADIQTAQLRTQASIELRLRPYSAERDTVAVDMTVVVGRPSEVLIPIRPAITPMEIVASALAKMGLTEGIEKYSPEDVQTGEPLTGSIWATGSGGTRLITRTVRLVHAKAMIAFDDEKINLLREAISASRKEKSEMQDVVMHLKQMLLGMNDLQAEHTGLKEKYTDLQGRMQGDRSTQQSEMLTMQASLLAAKDSSRAERADRKLRYSALEDKYKQAVRAKEEMAVFEQQVQVMDETMREKDVISMKHVKAEQMLREKMQRKYEVQAKKADGGDPGLAALETSANEMAAVVDVLRGDLATAMQTIYEKKLAQVELESKVASLRSSGAGSAHSSQNSLNTSTPSLNSQSTVNSTTIASPEAIEKAMMELNEAKKKLVEDNFKQGVSAQELRQQVAELNSVVQEHANKPPPTLAERLGPIADLVSDRMLLQFTLKKIDGGIGMTLQAFEAKVENDVRAGVYVKSLRLKGPADQSGLRRGDQIVAVDGTTMVGKSKDQGIGRLKQTGEFVNIVVARNPVVGGSAVSGVAGLRASEATMRTLAGEVAAAKKETTASEAKQTALKEKLEKIETERTMLLTELQGNAESNEGSATVITTLEARITDQTATIASLEESLAAKEMVVEQLRVEVVEAGDAAIVVSASKKHAVAAEVKVAIAAEVEKTAALVAAKDKAETELVEAQQALEMSKEEYTLLIDASEAKQDTLRESSDEVKKLRIEVATARERGDEQQEAYGNLKTEAQAMLVTEEAKRAAAENELLDLQKQLTKVGEAHTAELKQVREVCDMELTSALTKVTTADRVKAAVGDELAELKAAHTELIEQQSAAGDDAGEVRAKLAATITDLRAANAAKEDAEMALEAAVDALKDDADTKDELIAKLQSEVTTLQETGAQQLYVLQNQLMQQQQEYQRMQTEFTFQAQQRHQQVDTQNQQLRTMLGEAQTETERAKGELSARDLTISSLQIERDALSTSLAKQTAAAASASSSNFVDGMDAEEVAVVLGERKAEIEKLEATVKAAKEFIHGREPDLGKDLDRHLRRGGSVRRSVRSRKTESGTTGEEGESAEERASVSPERTSSRRSHATTTPAEGADANAAGGGTDTAISEAVEPEADAAAEQRSKLNRDRGGSLARRRREKEIASETPLERRRREKAEAKATAGN
jgi:protein tyrosine phosphatase/chromosome segregation ATPase